MNAKTLFRTLVLAALVLGMVGNAPAVYAEDSPPATPALSVVVAPSSVNVGEGAVLTVSLDNVPAEGYASAEISCTYPVELVSVGDTTDKGLFGADPVVASLGAINGDFLYAIAGKNGTKATTGGAVIDLALTVLQEGTATITCAAKVSTGDGTLTDLTPVSVTLDGTNVGYINGGAVANKAVTVQLYQGGNPFGDPISPDANDVFSTAVPAGTYTVRATSPGYLSAENAAVTVVSGAVTDMEKVTLLAGDIDANGVIDQLDAMTIGMSYNTATPDAADLNADGTINVLDLELLAANYLVTGPLPWFAAMP